MCGGFFFFSSTNVETKNVCPIAYNVWLCATPFNNKIVTTYLHGLINGCILKEGSPHLPEKIIL